LRKRKQAKMWFGDCIISILRNRRNKKKKRKNKNKNSWNNSNKNINYEIDKILRLQGERIKIAFIIDNLK